MKFKEYQKLAQETAIYPGKGENIVYPALGLNGEAWELYEKAIPATVFINKKAIAKEIGDCLWYIQDIAFETDIDLSSEWDREIYKRAAGNKGFEDLVIEVNIRAGAIAEFAKKQLRDGTVIDKIMFKEHLLICFYYCKKIAFTMFNGTVTSEEALEYVANLNIEKLKTRKKNGTIKGSGDDR